MNDRGFTLIELLVASALLVAVMGAVAGMAGPLRDGFERSIAGADLAGGSRTVLDRLAAEIREAGSGASIGEARFADLVVPVVPLASLGSTTWADPGQALHITRVPLHAPQGRLQNDAGSGATTLTLDVGAGCTAIGAGCGLRAGMSAFIYDPAHAQAVTVADATGNIVRLTGPLTSPFAAGSVIAAVTATAYGVRPAPDGGFRLMRATAASEQPVLDGVVDFSVRVRGPDPFHPRDVEISLRVEAPSPSMRGPAGVLFRRAGTALRPASCVPDVELRTTVGVRNGAG